MPARSSDFIHVPAQGSAFLQHDFVISAETDEARLGSTIVDLSVAGVYSVTRASCAGEDAQSD